MNDELKQKKIIQISLIAGICLILGIIWLLTLKYNLRGGFGKKENTVSPVQANNINELDSKIKLFKEQLEMSKEKINELIKK